MQNLTLELSGVTYEVPADQDTLHILKGCDLQVQPCQSIAIIGRSGSGKSTLLSLMAGLELVSDGEVKLLGQSLQNTSESERALIRANHVGFVFQNFQLMPTMTALENVMMPLELFAHSDIKAKAMQALEKVELSHRIHHLPNQLSGGEQQRVAIARAIVTNPKILFADEPTGNLDETTAEHVQQLLFTLQKELNTSLVIVTHDNDYAAKCDQQYLLQHGVLNLVEADV